MFKQENNAKNFKEVETIIGRSVKVKGNFNGQGNIIVEGILEGTLKTAGSVLIGEKAKIIANISSKEACIKGEINGNLKINGFLEIGATANITGDIECSSLLIANGAILNGKCTMTLESNKKNKKI